MSSLAERFSVQLPDDWTPQQALAVYELLNELAEQHPDLPQVWLNLGRCWDLKKNTANTVDCFQQALDKGCRDAEVLRRAVQILYQRQEFILAYAKHAPRVAGKTQGSHIVEHHP